MNKWMIWRYPHKMETSICPYMSHEFRLEMVIPTMRTPGSEFGSTTTYQRCFGFWNQRSIPWISSYPTVFSQHFRISMWKCWENGNTMGILWYPYVPMIFPFHKITWSASSTSSKSSTAWEMGLSVTINGLVSLTAWARTVGKTWRTTSLMLSSQSSVESVAMFCWNARGWLKITKVWTEQNG